jgi:hypothetical protein
MDAVRSGKESIASRLNIRPSEVHKDTRFIPIRRNSLRRIRDSSKCVCPNSLPVDECHKNLLVIAIARNGIRRVKECLSHGLVIAVTGNGFSKHASLVTVRGDFFSRAQDPS